MNLIGSVLVLKVNLLHYYDITSLVFCQVIAQTINEETRRNEQINP